MVVKQLLEECGLYNIYLMLLIGFLVLLYIWCNGNPFLTLPELENSIANLPEERKRRLLRTTFNENKVPPAIDVVIIGSGISSLVCAGCLSRMGKKVLILEQHDRAGGSSHTFEMQGFEFDVGVHYLGGMKNGEMNNILFDVLTDGQLKWDKLDTLFDAVVYDEKDASTIFYGNGDDEECAKSLVKHFPNEEKAIKKFDVLLKRPFEQECKKAVVAFALMKILPKFITKFLLYTGLHGILFPRYKELTETSVEDVLNDLTNDPKLKLMFTYAFGDYGTYPSEAPFLMHGMLMDHFREGAFYPREGSMSLAKHMVPGILRAGGGVLVNATVEKILTDDKGKVSGVAVKRQGKSITIHAPIVVSSIGVFNTFRNLLPPQLSAKYDVDLTKLDVGPSCFQTFIGLNGTSDELHLEKRNYWISNDLNMESALRNYLALSAEEAVDTAVPVLFVSFPSAKDSCWQDRYPGKSVCAAVTFVNWKWFEEWESLAATTTKDHVYSELKLGIQDQIKKVILKNFPQLTTKIDFIESGTPLSHKHYLGSPIGDIYGINHSMKRFQPDLGMSLRPATPIPGLYLTGQDIFTCGIAGAAVSGILTSGSIQGRIHFLDLYAAMFVRRCRQFWNSVFKKGV